MSTKQSPGKIYFLGLLVAFGLMSAGCATVPRESAQLSQALSEQLADLQDKHIALANQYFNEVEARIRQTIMVGYKDAMVDAVKKRLAAKGQTLTTDEYDLLMDRVMVKLDQALGELSQEKSAALKALTDRYGLMESENAELTRLLASASNLEAKRKMYTSEIEDKEKSYEGYLGKADTTLQNYIGETEKAKAAVQQTGTALEEIINGK